MPLVISRARLSLRLMSGVLLACALTLCLTGLAQPAMAMPAHTESMYHMAESADATEQALNTAAAVKSPGWGDSCSSSADNCAQPSAVSPHGNPTAQAAPACSDVPRMPVAFQPEGIRSGVPPPVESGSPPDLHRLCVSRT